MAGNGSTWRDRANDSAFNGAMEMFRKFGSIAGLLLAVEAFAVWAVFALPRFTGRADIREAWDSEAYWMFGIPVLLGSLALAGVLSRKPAWLLAAYAAAGHALAVALIAKDGSSLGLLPLTIILIGVPLFALFAVAAWLGRKVRGMIQSS